MTFFLELIKMTTVEDEDLEFDLNGKSKLFLYMHLGPREQVLVV